MLSELNCNQTILQTEFKFEGFTIDSCRSMVALLDTDMSGKLGIDEFQDLWKKIKKWSEIFRKHDQDNSHTISASELRVAFHESGISLNRHILQVSNSSYFLSILTNVHSAWC